MVAEMKLRNVGLAFCSAALFVALSVGRADAADSDDTSAVEKKAMTAFALGRYAEAAESFERAFELKPEPALLYNAAQAHRLAGNKERALSLYENYLRVYGKRDKREEVETHIVELKQAIEHDKAVATSPPTGTEPTAGAAVASPPVLVIPPPSRSPAGPPVASLSPSPSSPSVLVSQPTPAQADDRSLVEKPWFWVVVGGGVVAAVVVGVLVASGGSKDPSPSFGKASGN
jgi:hypothetical protein